MKESPLRYQDSSSGERHPAPKKEKPGGAPKKGASQKESPKENQKESLKEKKQLEKRIRTLEEERQQREKEERRSERQRSRGEESRLSRGGRGDSRFSRGPETGFDRGAEEEYADGGRRRARSRRNPEVEPEKESVTIIRETESSGSSFADAAVKGVTGVVILMSRVMQLVCVLLMAGMVLASARAFWYCSSGLGTIDTMITDRNYGLALYVGAAAFSLFMGVIWCFWILSRKAAGGNVRLKKYDTGRGFIPFIFCAAVVFAAGPVSMLVPADGAAWHGLAAGAKAVLEAVNSNHSFLAFCSVAGVILSLVRKLLRV